MTHLCSPRMFSENQIKETPLQNRLKKSAFKEWESLTDNKKNILKKVWKVITYKWQWQMALNAPVMAIWIMDQKIPAVHQFDMKLMASLPIPNWLISFFGS